MAEDMDSGPGIVTERSSIPVRSIFSNVVTGAATFGLTALAAMATGDIVVPSMAALAALSTYEHIIPHMAGKTLGGVTSYVAEPVLPVLKEDSSKPVQYALGRTLNIASDTAIAVGFFCAITFLTGGAAAPLFATSSALIWGITEFSLVSLAAKGAAYGITRTLFGPEGRGR